MDKVTPGRKLILDLLAKSVAKIQAESVEAIYKKVKDDARAEAINKEGKDEMGKSQKKRKSAFEIPKHRKKMKVDSFKVDPESKYLPVEHLQIEMKTESPGIDDEDKNRKTKKKSIKMEIQRGKEMNKNELEFSVKSETQENTDLASPMIEQKVKPVKRKIKSEIIEKDVQEEPDDTKREPFKIKSEYTESKIEVVDLDNKVYHGTTEQFSEDKFNNELNIFKKDPTATEDIKTENKFYIKSSKNDLKILKLESNFDPKDGEEIRKQKGNVTIGKRRCNPNRSAGFNYKRFTPEEDKVLIEAINKYGYNLDIKQIARDLDRDRSSIKNRIKRLKTDRTGKEAKSKYTLEEDIFILDAVLKHLNEQSLKNLNLSSSEWKEVGDQIGRGLHVKGRWRALKPWILQHYAGTFNLDIRRPLANYLADNFNDVNSIDWDLVANLPDFVGHTQESLRQILCTTLTSYTQRKLNKSRKDLSLRMIADVANTVFYPGSRVELETNVERQKEIVEYFESYVKRNSITNFLGK